MSTDVPQKHRRPISCPSLPWTFQRNAPGVPANYRTFGFWSANLQKALLQRNNFPLHFLSWTKTPLKWMAFAHSLWPQLAALLATLVLWPQNRRTRDEGRSRGSTQQVQTHETTAIIVLPPSRHQRPTWQVAAWFIYLPLICQDGRFPHIVSLVWRQDKKAQTKMFDSLFALMNRWISE